MSSTPKAPTSTATVLGSSPEPMPDSWPKRQVEGPGEADRGDGQQKQPAGKIERRLSPSPRATARSRHHSSLPTNVLSRRVGDGIEQ